MLENFTDFVSPMSEWMSYIAIASIVFFIVSIVLIPKIIARIPSNYFIVRSDTSVSSSASVGKLMLSIFRNIIGSFLIFCGIVMLITPGQGLLTILAGLFILDFPGKFKLELYLIKKPSVLKTLNWIRHKQNVPDFQLPE